MKTFLMTLAAAGAAGSAPAMAQFGYHDDSAHHRYAPASYGTTSYGTTSYGTTSYGSGFNVGYGTSYNYAARPYAVSTYGTGGHYDYDPSPVHGFGHGMNRPATVHTPSYRTGYGATYSTYRPAASSWGHTDSDHHVYGW